MHAATHNEKSDSEMPSVKHKAECRAHTRPSLRLVPPPLAEDDFRVGDHRAICEQILDGAFIVSEDYFFGVEKPHVFIRVAKYKEVMTSVNELHNRIANAKKDLEDMHDINTEESRKLKEAAEILLKIEDILRYLETTFTSPEA